MLSNKVENIKNFLLEYKLIDTDTVQTLQSLSEDRITEFFKDLVQSYKLNFSQIMNCYAQSFKKKTYYEILLDAKLITLQDLQEIVNEHSGIPANLGEILVERKKITEEDAARVLALELGLEYVDLSNYKVDDELFNSLDINLMKKYNFIPDKKTDKEYYIIMANPQDVDMIEEIEVKLGLPIIPKVASYKSIQKLLSHLIETSLDSKVVFADLESIPKLEVISDESDDQASKEKAIRQHLQEEASVVKLVDAIILKAVRKRASDIHFEVYENNLKVKYRIDGVLFEVLSDIDPALRLPIISRLKVMAQLDIAEKRIPQDGRFKLKIDERFIDFRVSVLPSIFGETVVLRILDKATVGLDILKLGLEDNDLLLFQRNIMKPYGMILVAGPTGSGKTTTLYSAIRYIHTPGDKFITIEDPVEYQIPDIVQIPVNEKKGLTFSAGLRSIVRQDPDKIMVGEIRDPETAKIAINAALTGHLVLSSIHANNVIDAISRLSNMNIDPYEFVSSFNLIMSQRLVRLICSNCKTIDTTITDEAKKLTIDFEQHKNIHFMKGAGCRYCHKTGYQGRTGIFEVLEMTPQIKQMILTKQSPLTIKKKAVEQGMIPLRQAGWKKVELGLTTFEELNRVTFDEGLLE